MSERETFNFCIAAIGSSLTYVFGCWDEPLKILIILMIIDYTTGVMSGCINKKLNSNVGFNGILRKATILLVLIVSVLLDRLLNQGTWVFRTVVAYFYVANESLSILENCGKCGVPLPKKLLKALEQLKDRKELI